MGKILAAEARLKEEGERNTHGDVAKCRGDRGMTELGSASPVRSAALGWCELNPV